MLQQARMPYVRFVADVTETKDASGHIQYKNVYFAHITPAGGKDEVVKVADEWLADLRRKGDARGNFDTSASEYARWHDFYKEQFEKFKAGEEMTVDGTPLRACLAFTKAEIAQAENANVYSLEDLAACNEEAIGRMGVGARTLKIKAQELLKTKNSSATAQEVSSLKAQIEELRQTIQAMKDMGMKEPPEIEKETPKRGRPRKETAEV